MKISRPSRILLWPASVLYGLVTAMRTRFYAKGWLKRKRLNAAVISVGNISVGGTGKTPLVIWLAERLLQQGKRVAILTRGYRGIAGTSDEVELMKSRLQNRVAFGVGKDRFTRGQQLESKQAVDVFLLDDGFQHLQLARDLDIVLIDASRPMGGQALLPAGRMREPVSAIARANIIVFTRTENAPGAERAIRALSYLPVFAASTRLLGFRRLTGDDSLIPVTALGAGPLFVFCGIGNPAAFLRDLQRSGIPVAGHMFFADHHRYALDDVRNMEQAAQRAGATAFITTEKDTWNLATVKFTALPVYVSIIELEVAEEGSFLSAVNGVIQSHGVLV
jgi:tetraacyldisaccharide 4'-kinase